MEFSANIYFDVNYEIFMSSPVCNSYLQYLERRECEYDHKITVDFYKVRDNSNAISMDRFFICLWTISDVQLLFEFRKGRILSL